MTTAWEELLPRLHELADLESAIRLLDWDQLVMMPPKGAPARARALATIEAIHHDKLTNPELGELLEELSGDSALDEDQSASVRILKRDYDKATRVPEKLVRELAQLRAITYQTWTEARPASDFKMLEPHLSRLVGLKKEEADALGHDGERYDALLDIYEPESTTAEIKEMFEGLGRGLQPLAEAILEVAGPRPEFLGRTSSTQAQESACRWIAEQLGFDFHSGRLDTSPHPFTSGIGAGDVRQTTRPEARGLLNAIYAVLHETGHGLYEQRIPLKLRGLPVGRTASFGMHESQSRLWENQVGRSRSFTDFLLPRLKDRFPEVLGDVPPDEFHRGVNHPERGPIRINADEVTYNLHLLVRFELGLALFRDELEVKDLPGAWNEKMESHLGIKPEDDASGVLQDMHWPSGNFGYFPTYTIGTLYGAAIFLEAGRQLPDLQREMRAGDTSSLLDWLTQNVYERAYRYPANRLVEQILGSKPSAQPFLTYLATKYSEIYDTDLSA